MVLFGFDYRLVSERAPLGFRWLLTDDFVRYLYNVCSFYACTTFCNLSLECVGTVDEFGADSNARLLHKLFEVCDIGLRIVVLFRRTFDFKNGCCQDTGQ